VPILIQHTRLLSLKTFREVSFIFILPELYDLDFLLVGLGNPGKMYDNTRHNIGFACIDRFVEKHNVSWRKNLTSYYCGMSKGGLHLAY
jgi:hypothetical protein